MTEHVDDCQTCGCPPSHAVHVEGARFFHAYNPPGSVCKRCNGDRYIVSLAGHASDCPVCTARSPVVPRELCVPVSQELLEIADLRAQRDALVVCLDRAIRNIRGLTYCVCEDPGCDEAGILKDADALLADPDARAALKKAGRG